MGYWVGLVFHKKDEGGDMVDQRPTPPMNTHTLTGEFEQGGWVKAPPQQ